ncbi:MAG: CRISPR-associated protein Csx16 [Ostreibacterium sp.]
MTTYFISRHQRVKDWIASQDIHLDKIQVHLDIDDIQSGDTVIGTLPINLVATLCKLGAIYYHLTLALPKELRGKALSLDDMLAAGAKLEQFTAEKICNN